MRLLRALPVAGILLTMTGDGRKAPPPVLPTFTNETCTVPQVERLPGIRAAMVFWYRMKGSERVSLSVPADARVSRVYARIVAKARSRGFRFDAPKVRQTKPELVLLLGPGIRYVHAMHYSGPRTILLNGWLLETRWDETDLEYVLAHELAHAIDFQNERAGHWILDVFKDTDDADFVADMMSIMLARPDAYERFRKRHPGITGDMPEER